MVKAQKLRGGLGFEAFEGVAGWDAGRENFFGAVSRHVVGRGGGHWRGGALEAACERGKLCVCKQTVWWGRDCGE